MLLISHWETVDLNWRNRFLEKGIFLKKMDLLKLLCRLLKEEKYTSEIHIFSSSDSFPKLRPIVSSIGTFNYNLARFHCNLLSPHDYSCKDTFSFLSQI